jgi:hypothetical protein
MVLASIHVLHNTVHNYLSFWVLVYRAVPWYVPPVQYQLQYVYMYATLPLPLKSNGHRTKIPCQQKWWCVILNQNIFFLSLSRYRYTQTLEFNIYSVVVQLPP